MSIYTLPLMINRILYSAYYFTRQGFQLRGGGDLNSKNFEKISLDNSSTVNPKIPPIPVGNFVVGF